MAMRWTRCGLGLTNDLGEVVGPPPPQDVLAWMYLKSKQDGTLPMVCYQGIPDVRQWLDWYSRGEGEEVIANPGAWTANGSFLGMGFINAIERKQGLTKAEVGFMFCKEVSVFRQIDFMRAMISLIFLQTDIDCLLGTTPTPNTAACAMVKRLGMRTFEMPMYSTWRGQPCSCLLSQTDRSHWFNGPGRDFQP
jgi:hypothetical protein